MDQLPITTCGTSDWKANLDYELQAKPLETDNFDVLLSPLAKNGRLTSNRSSLTQIGNNMMAYFNLKKFVQKVCRDRENFKCINQKHLNIINDRASDHQGLLISNKHKKKLKIFDFQQLIQVNFLQRKWDESKRFIQSIIDKIPLIHADSWWKVIWDYFMCLIRIIMIVLIPLDIAFNPNIMYGSAISFTIITVILMVMDTLFSINTIFYKDGKAIVDRWEILIHKNVAVKDGLAIFCLVLNFPVQLRWIMILYFVQLGNVFEVLSRGNESSYFSKPVQGLIKLIQFILTLISILHLFSCIWFKISQNSGNYSWVEVQGLLNQNWTACYIEAFYFATVTMLTIGYGDTVPINQTEKMISIVFILGACLWYSYAVNTIGFIINEISSNSDLRKANMRVINGYMSRRRIPYSLQYRIREYLNYRWKQEEEQDFILETQLINELSDDLKENLEMIGRKTFVEKCEFLQNFSNEFRNSLISFIKREIIQPQNYHESNGICYIEQGEMQLLQCSYKAGEFLAIELRKPPQSYRAIGYVSLLTLEKETFFKQIRQYPKDNEIFCQIRDQIDFEESSELTYCKLCEKQSHSVYQCPLIQYIPDRECVIKRHQFEKVQRRNPFRRRCLRNYFRALQDSEMISEYVEYFQTDKVQVVQEYLKKQLQVFLRTSIENSPEEMFTEFGPKRDSLFGQRTLQPQCIAPSPNLKSTQNHNNRQSILFLGVQKARTTELDRSYQFKQVRIPDVQLFNKHQSDNIIALYQQMKKDEETIEEFKDVEYLYMQINSFDLAQSDQIRNYSTYYPKYNAFAVVRRHRVVNKIEFSKLIKYMFYPFVYLYKYHKPVTKKQRLTTQLQSAKNILKFKNVLLSKKMKNSQVSPQI